MPNYEVQITIAAHWEPGTDSYSAGDDGTTKLTEELAGLLQDIKVSGGATLAQWAEMEILPLAQKMTLAKVAELIKIRLDRLTYKDKPIRYQLQVPGENPPVKLVADVRYFYDFQGNCFHGATLYSAGAGTPDQRLTVDSTTTSGKPVQGELAAFFRYKLQ